MGGGSSLVTGGRGEGTVGTTKAILTKASMSTFRRSSLQLNHSQSKKDWYSQTKRSEANKALENSPSFSWARFSFSWSFGPRSISLRAPKVSPAFVRSPQAVYTPFVIGGGLCLRAYHLLCVALMAALIFSRQAVSLAGMARFRPRGKPCSFQRKLGRSMATKRARYAGVGQLLSGSAQCVRRC